MESTSQTFITLPPPATLTLFLLRGVPNQCFISGDFTCRHDDWGYPDSKHNGKILADWSCTHNLHTFYDPKQPASFHSARLNFGKKVNVTFSTHIAYKKSHLQEKSSNSFLTLSTALLGLVQCHWFLSPEQLQYLDGTSKNAPWETYKGLTNNLAANLPAPRMDNINFAYKQFTTTLMIATNHLKAFRKSYIPTWDEECSRLYHEYLDADSQCTILSSASGLTRLLDKQRHVLHRIDNQNSSTNCSLTFKIGFNFDVIRNSRPTSKWYFTVFLI